MPGEDAIAARWAQLEGMDRAALRGAWTEAFKAAPPNFLSMLFLRKALIHETQTRSFGGLSPELKRALKAAATGNQTPGAASAHGPGTQLVRDWNGQRYLVEVTEGGFVMDGKHYGSLSAIALQITGTHWSGPRFFGLSKLKSVAA